MTNNIDTIITEIERLLLLAGVKKTIRYPEQYKNIGNQYPLAIIKEGARSDIADSGVRYYSTWNLSISLIVPMTPTASDIIGNLEAAAFNQLFSDNTLGGLVINIDPMQTDTGGLNTGTDLLAFAGFNEASMCREISMTILCDDLRVEPIPAPVIFSDLEPSDIYNLHSFIKANGKIYAGTRRGTDPAIIVRFNDPTGDLSDYDYIEMPLAGIDDPDYADYGTEAGFQFKYFDAEAMWYSKELDKIFVLFLYDGTFSSIIELDPDTLDWAPVVCDFVNQGADDLCGDANYLYCVSINTPAEIIKYDLVNRTAGRLDFVSKLTLDYSGGHAIKLHGGNLYATGVSQPGWCVKVDASTLELGGDVSFLPYGLQTGITDDICIAEGHVWCGVENTYGMIIKVRISDMTMSVLDTNVNSPCFGCFYEGRYIWVCYWSKPAMLVRIDPVTNAMRYYELSELTENGVNELVWFPATRDMVLSTWGDYPAIIYRFKPDYYGQ